MIKNHFSTDDRVWFDLTGDGSITGTATILSQSSENIIDYYVVLLDKPITGQDGKLYKGLNLSSQCMKLTALKDCEDYLSGCSFGE